MRDNLTVPMLEITDGRGNLLPNAGKLVLATMFFPHDAKARGVYAEALVAGTATHIGLRNPKFGMAVAGDLLMILWELKHMEKPDSLRKAVEVWSGRRRGDLKDGGRGGPIPVSRSVILQAWSRYKGVSPLCAAGHLHVHAAKLDPADYQRQWGAFLDAFANSANLLSTLAVAEAFRDFGEEHFPPWGRSRTGLALKPTLDPATTWRTPPDLKLPEMVLELSFGLFPVRP